MVIYLKESPQRRTKLHLCCQLAGLKQLEPIQDVDTRWNSILDMLERFIYLRSAVESYCAMDPGAQKLMPSRDEWEALPGLKAMLTLMKDITSKIEGDRFVFTGRFWCFYELKVTFV